MVRRFLRPDLIAVGVALIMFGLLTGARHLRMLQRLELQAYDLMLRMRHDDKKRNANIVIVGIDEDDIRTHDYPFSDGTLAELLRKILASEPRGIGLDLYRDLPEPRDGSQLANLEAVLLPNKNIITILSINEEGKAGSGVPAPIVLKSLSEEERDSRVTFNDFPADGETVRRAFLFRRGKEGDKEPKTFTSFALRLALLDLPFEADARGVAMPEVEFSPETARIGRGVFQRLHGNDGGYFGIPDGGFQFLIDYRGSDSFPQYSFRDILAGRVAPETFRDRVVLIGGVSHSIKDVLPTPIDADGSGVALHAQVIDQIIRAALDGEQPTLALASRWHAWWTLIWALLGSASALALLRWPRVAPLGIGAGLLALIIVKHWAFQRGWWLPLVEPGLAYVLSSGASLLVVFAWERMQRSELMQLFSRHVSSKVASNIWRQRETFLDGSRPKPQELTATVLFTDYVGFSTVSERIDASTLMEWLNDGMGRIARHVEPHGGIVNKFIGDAIMAIFGVPVPRNTRKEIAEDAAGAVRCALAMGRELDSLNAEWRRRGWPEIGMRIGIHTGVVVAGSLGSKSRLEFTVIGDTVNTAARLESCSKEEIPPPLGRCCRILIGQSTYELVAERFEVDSVGAIALQGKKNALEAYRVLSEIPAEHASHSPLLETAL